MKLPNGVAQTIHDVLSEYSRKRSIEELPISVDVLRSIIRERCGLKTLEWQEVPVETKNLLGNVKFYYPVPKDVRTAEAPTTAIVRFTSSLNFCWRRFVIAKEMCHCLFDSKEDSVTNVDELKKLIEGLASKISISLLGDNKKLASEEWAELMALELLYPMELRRTHIKLLRAGEITTHSLALRYRIPDEYAALGVGEHFLESAAQILRDNKFIRE